MLAGFFLRYKILNEIVSIAALLEPERAMYILARERRYINTMYLTLRVNVFCRFNFKEEQK